jgi:hypothetical protein
MCAYCQHKSRISDVLQEHERELRELLRLRDYGRTPATGDLQVAAFLARGYSLCCPLVPSLLAFISGCPGTAIERGLKIDHTTIWRWVQRYAPELEERTRPHLKPTNKSWRVDETYVRVKGRWFGCVANRSEEAGSCACEVEWGQTVFRPRVRLMNRTCPLTSPFSNHLTCPFADHVHHFIT